MTSPASMATPSPLQRGRRSVEGILCAGAALARAREEVDDRRDAQAQVQQADDDETGLHGSEMIGRAPRQTRLTITVFVAGLPVPLVVIRYVCCVSLHANGTSAEPVAA